MRAEHLADEFDPRFKIFHELMAQKIRSILLVSTPYDAWIMEEDCRLSERIINEYRGLNLSHPPKLTWVSSVEEALSLVEQNKFDMVITMLRPAGMDAFAMGRKINRKAPDLPVILLSHSVLPSQDLNLAGKHLAGADQAFVWSGNTEILVALIKSVEDKLNVEYDTKLAGIRVILLVEDSPIYLSSFLPIVYKEMVRQTQNLIEEGLNEEHRLLTMRARPKILIANNFETALSIYESYKPYILGVISDARFPRSGKLDGRAGISLLEHIKQDRWDIPLLLNSSEPANTVRASKIPATFIDKNSPSLNEEIRAFFLEQLGFGDFVFRMPDSGQIERAPSLRSFEKVLPDVPDESFYYHWSRNDFSRWFFARTEIVLASKMRPTTAADFSNDVQRMKDFLVSNLKKLRQRRQKGVVVNFDPVDFDLETDFFKIGNGSLGGKARGLAFISTMLRNNLDIHRSFDSVRIFVPQTLVITTEGFDAFIEKNDLKYLSRADISDEDVATKCKRARLPKWITGQLRAYLERVHYPLAVRSSSLLEDAQFRAYAGLYRTYMVPNDYPDLDQRLEQLITAIKLIYASTYFNSPKVFSRRVGQRVEEEKMAIIIQQLVGERQGNYFYPAISGVAQSYNYYPFSKMKPEEGIINIALGLGKMVMEGEKTLRFSPRYPQLLPQMAKVDDILRNSQQVFYALKMGESAAELEINEDTTLELRDVMDALEESALKQLTSTYIAEEHRIRDTISMPGRRVLTFAQVLKYDLFPLAKLLSEILNMGEHGMGCPVEVEFSVNLSRSNDQQPEFAILQVRPMTALEETMTVDINSEEIAGALCYSTRALGNTDRDDITDVLYVKPDAFDPARTREIAAEIGTLNAELTEKDRKYLLVGPGRWGSADRWLGIPVQWADISGIGAIVETFSGKLTVESSQGSHFFHNITTLGINYITVDQKGESFWDWDRLADLPKVRESTYMVHACAVHPIRIKVDGRKSECVILLDS